MCHARKGTHKPLGHILPLFFLKYGHFRFFFLLQHDANHVQQVHT